MMKSSAFYPDALANLFQSAKAWRTVALVVIGMFIVQTVVLLHTMSQRTVLLIPQGLPVTKGGITLNLGEPFTPEYLTALAKGDIYSLLSWTPDNVEQQYGLFLSRLASGLYDEKRTELLEEAKAHKAEGLTQSFYTTRHFVNGGEVTLHGVLVRAMAGKEVFRGPAAYAITYSNVGNGELTISGVRQPTAEEYRATQQAAAEAAQAAKISQNSK